jgi:hypothetical protein
MALQKFKAPILPVPTPAYDVNYMSQFIRALGNYFVLLDSTTPIQVDSIILSNTPTNAGGLAIGSVYSDDGTLKIVLPNKAYAASLKATATVNNVSVTTT